MALTIAAPTIAKGGDGGSPLFVDIVNITGDTSYPTGGEACDTLIKAQIGTNRTIAAVIQLGGCPVNTWHTYYDRANSKLMMYTEDEAEVVNTTDVSTFAAVPHLVLSY